MAEKVWVPAVVKRTGQQGGMGASASNDLGGRTKKIQLQQERSVSRSELIELHCTSLSEDPKLQVRELHSALDVLKMVALKLGLPKETAPLLQMEFAGATVAHTTTMEQAGLCEGSLFSVLGEGTARAKEAAPMPTPTAPTTQETRRSTTVFGRVIDVATRRRMREEKWRRKDQCVSCEECLDEFGLFLWKHSCAACTRVSSPSICASGTSAFIAPSLSSLHSCTTQLAFKLCHIPNTTPQLQPSAESAVVYRCFAIPALGTEMPQTLGCVTTAS